MLSPLSPCSLSPMFKYTYIFISRPIFEHSSVQFANVIHNLPRYYSTPSNEFISHLLSVFISALSSHSSCSLSLTRLLSFLCPSASPFIGFALLYTVSFLPSDAEPSQALTLSREIDRHRGMASQSPLSCSKIGKPDLLCCLTGSLRFTTVMSVWFMCRVTLFSEQYTHSLNASVHCCYEICVSDSCLFAGGGARLGCEDKFEGLQEDQKLFISLLFGTYTYVHLIRVLNWISWLNGSQLMSTQRLW